MTESEFLKLITQSINELLSGDSRVKQRSFPVKLSDSNNENELRKLNQSVNNLIEKYQDADHFILNLSKGNLDTEVPKSNQLISPFKELQSNLRHLVWQTHRIAEGDYSQRIDFLGDFSTSYNYLISSLREKQVLENELSISEEKYRMLAQNVSDVIWKFDILSGKLTFISPSVFKLLGYSVEEALTLRLDQLFTFESKESIYNSLQQKLADHRDGDENALNYTSELRMVCKDGTVIWVESVINLLVDSSNTISEILGVTRNVDKRKEAEEELKNYANELRELNATKDKFFSIIAHDLRNPFNALLNLSDYIIDNIEEDNKPKAIELAGYMKNSAQNAYNLLQNLLEWSALQQGGIHFNPSYNKLLPLVNEELLNLENIAIQKNIRIELSIAGTLIVKADQNMLKTILRNLIGNALKYTYDGGEIFIGAEKIDSTVLIKIKDSGTGMNSEEQNSLFQLNTGKSKPGTKQEKGSGLGLILCKEFVASHNGTIWVESEPGKGSTFFIRLPL
jgi:PAS domain S-box-containing protein